MTTGARLGGGFLALAALCGVARPAPGPAAEEPTKAELTALAGLHRQAVMLFIERNGFGFSRMMPRIDDVLGPPKSQGGTAVAVPEDPMAIRAGADGKGAHFSFTRAVGRAAHIPAPVPWKAWVVKEVQLVGLVKHPDPVVYVTGGAAVVEAKDVKTRRPDAFEAKALEVIRGGGELVQAEKRGDALRAVGGVYAGRQCLKCHERPGEMLGAFSYRLAVEDLPAKGTAPGADFPFGP